MNESSLPLLMGLDLGSSATKGVVINSSGATLATVSDSSTLIHREKGWVEFDPEEHYRGVCRVIRTLASAVTESIGAIAMCAASGNTLLTDGAGKPLTQVISWMDQRVRLKKLPILESIQVPMVRRIVGWPCVDTFPLSHLAWFRDLNRQMFHDAMHYCMNTDWLLFRLTGNWVMDHSTGTTFHLQDQVTRTYHEPLLRLLGIREERLSRLVPSGTTAGALSAEAAEETFLPAGTPVITGSFDHPSAARAVGVLEPGQLMLSCGTSWVGFFPDEDRQRIVDAELLCDPYLSGSGGPWGAMCSVPQIGRTIDWYIDNVIAPEEADRVGVFNESAASAEPGADGLRIDLRKTPAHIRADRKNVSRAVMEGAARLLADELARLAERGIRFDHAVMVGGPAGSAVWPGIVEDMTGISITAGSSHSGARGAALLAGIGAGVYRDETEAFAATGGKQE